MQAIATKEELSQRYEQEIIDAIKSLPLEQRLQAIALNNYLLQKKSIEAAQEKRTNEAVNRSNKRQAPVLQALNEIISGKRAPTEAEIKQFKEHLTPEEVGKISASLTAEQIPEYWFKVLTSCAKIQFDIHENDHGLLKHVTIVEHIAEEENDNFSIKFTFSPNEYIENESLTVRFVMFSEDQVEKTEGTEIKWKAGKDITKKTVTQKQRNKKTGKTRDVTKTIDSDSFFNFFKTVEVKEFGQEEDEEDDEERDIEDEGMHSLSVSYSIARAFQEEIIPFHLEFFLGIRKGDEDEEGFEGFDEEDDEDDEGDDDDDDEEDEAPRRGKGGKGGKGGKSRGGAQGGKQECKQQ